MVRPQMDARRLYEGGYFYESKQVGATRSARCTCLVACCWLCQHRDCRPWVGDRSNYPRCEGYRWLHRRRQREGAFRHRRKGGPIVGDEVKFRNQVIGFGGNVGFVTLDGAYTTPAEGVAYRCPASL